MNLYGYTARPKILPPRERPGEVLANHAPYVVLKDGLYHMVYGHSPIRLAASPDLFDWEPRGELFSDPDGARDPSLLYHDGSWYGGAVLRPSSDQKAMSRNLPH